MYRFEGGRERQTEAEKETETESEREDRLLRNKVLRIPISGEVRGHTQKRRCTIK